MLRFGYKASAEQFSPTQLLALACAAEEAGFDSVFISDHFQPWKHTDGHAPFSLSWLGAAAARTDRIVLGTSVLTPTFRYHPAMVAQAFATLGVMFPDRFIVGVGTGESLNEVPATGIAWSEFRERFARLREAVDLMRALWTQERVTFDGQYYHTRNATLYDRPDVAPPVYVAAGGPLVARYAGYMGDGFICTSGKEPAFYDEKIIPNIEQGLSRREGATSGYGRMIEMKVSFDTDIKAAREATRHWAALALSAEEKHSVADPMEMEELARALPLERAAARWQVSADPEEHVEQVAAYIRRGFNHLVFHAPGPDQQRFLSLYAKEILPRLRRRFGAA